MKARQEESNIATDRASTKQKYNARSRPHPVPKSLQSNYNKLDRVDLFLRWVDFGDVGTSEQAWSRCSASDPREVLALYLPGFL